MAGRKESADARGVKWCGPTLTMISCVRERERGRERKKETFRTKNLVIHFLVITYAFTLFLEISDVINYKYENIMRKERKKAYDYETK